MPKKETLHTNIVDELRKGILEGRFRLGEWLRQDEIAARFNVSRMPVREALVQLEAEGLVDLYRHRGAQVKPLSIKEIKELFSIRILLEGEAAFQGASKVSEQDLALMQQLIADMRCATEVGEYLKLNERFHSTLYGATGSHYLEKMIAEIRINVERYLRIYMGLLEQVDLRHSEHEAILQACKQKDGELAREATKNHVQGTAQTLVRTLGRAGIID